MNVTSKFLKALLFIVLSLLLVFTSSCTDADTDAPNGSSVDAGNSMKTDETESSQKTESVAEFESSKTESSEEAIDRLSDLFVVEKPGLAGKIMFAAASDSTTASDKAYDFIQARLGKDSKTKQFYAATKADYVANDPVPVSERPKADFSLLNPARYEMPYTNEWGESLKYYSDVGYSDAKTEGYVVYVMIEVTAASDQAIEKIATENGVTTTEAIAIFRQNMVELLTSCGMHVEAHFDLMYYDTYSYYRLYSDQQYNEHFGEEYEEVTLEDCAYDTAVYDNCTQFYYATYATIFQLDYLRQKAEEESNDLYKIAVIPVSGSTVNPEESPYESHKGDVDDPNGFCEFRAKFTFSEIAYRLGIILM